MNVTKRDGFCHQCSLQFDSKQIYSLHLWVVHKQENSKRSIKNELKSIKPISSLEISDSNSQIASDQNKKKKFKCKHCQYYSSQKGTLNVHIASVHERKKPFKCEFCDKTYSRKNDLNEHVFSKDEL